MPNDSLGQISKTAFFIFSLPHAKEETFSPFPRVRKRRCKSERRKSIRRKIICERRGDRREKHSRLFECRIQKQNRSKITEMTIAPHFSRDAGRFYASRRHFLRRFAARLHGERFSADRKTPQASSKAPKWPNRKICRARGH